SARDSRRSHQARHASGATMTAAHSSTATITSVISASSSALQMARRVRKIRRTGYQRSVALASGSVPPVSGPVKFRATSTAASSRAAMTRVLMSQSFAQRPFGSPKVWEFHPSGTPRPYNLATDMDERTFTTAAEAYATRLYTVAYRMLGNRADAEDAVQRALLKCYAARASYSPRWQVSTWLYRALANVCID